MTASTPLARVLFVAGFGGRNDAAGPARPVTPAGLDEALAAAAPRLALRIDGAETAFAPTALADFAPARVAELTGLPAAKLDAVLHHPEFQALEAAWRGLAFALERGGGDKVRFEILAASRPQVLERFEDAVFEDEYEDRSDVPLSLVVVDYDYTHNAGDLAQLRRMGDLGKAISAPWAASAGPGLFGIKNLYHLGTLPSVMQRFMESPYANLRSFQQTASARWVGLTVNRFLLREPHADASLGYTEATSPAHPEWRPWGRGVWAAAAAFAASVNKHGHAADLDGLQSSGDFSELPVFPYPTAQNRTEDLSVETLVPDERSLDLVHAGVSALLGQKGVGHAYFPMLSNLYRPQPGELTLEASIAHQLLLGELVHLLLRALPQAPADPAEAEPYFRERVGPWLAKFGDVPDGALTVQGVAGDEGNHVAISAKLPIRLHNHDPEFTFDLPLGGAS